MEKTNQYLSLGHYSALTIRNYLSELRYLFAYYADVDPKDFTEDMVMQYLLYLSKTLGCSRVKCKMAAQSISFFFRHVLKQAYVIPTVIYPRKSTKLPAVMPASEIKTLIDGVKNMKHRTIIMMLYSTGMRLGEIARVKIGSRPASPMSMRNIQHLVQKSLAQVGLESKNYTVHTIRHSFATHLVDNGTDLHTVKELLGHSNLQTTLRYLHLTSTRIQGIVNPYDRLTDGNKGQRAASSKK